MADPAQPATGVALALAKKGGGFTEEQAQYTRPGYDADFLGGVLAE
jgi:hypothetical protein